MNPKALIRGLTLICSLAACGLVLEAMGLSTALDRAWIDSEVRGRGLAGETLFVGAAALFVAVGLPRQIVSFLGGYAFGFVAGTGLALAASSAGCVATFSYSRLLGRDLVAARSPVRIMKLDEFLGHNPFSMTLLIRLLPVGSNLFTNLAAGVSSVNPMPFLVGSALGYLPQTAVFALVGSGINLDPAVRITLGVALFVVSGMLGVSLYRKYRHGKTLDEAIDRAVGEVGAQTSRAGPDSRS